MIEVFLEVTCEIVTDPAKVTGWLGERGWLDEGVAIHRVLNRAAETNVATKGLTMARTTGYACTAAVNLLAAGEFNRKGICPPEYVGRTPGCYEGLLAGYAERNIQLAETVEVL